MQLKNAIAAGALGALMAGSTLAFAASLSDFPAPFVSGGTADFLVVVGNAAQPSDVVGAIDLAARLGGAPVTTETVTCPGSLGGLSVSGEGKAVATSSTKVFLGDSLGKSGLRNTMTKDDLPTLLAKGTVTDSDAGTTHTYQQFIYLTPGSTTSQKYTAEFTVPGSASAADGTYNFGRFPTSPTNSTDYFYKSYVTFDTALNGTTAVGEKIVLFGNEYTISSGTDFTAAPQKLVLFGGAATSLLHGGESTTVTISGTTYTVKILGVDSSNKVSIQVGTESKIGVSTGVSTKIGGLDVYIDSASQLSSSDQTQNIAKLLFGAQKITLKDNSRILLTDQENPVDGTEVELGVTSSKLTSITVYAGAKSSTIDFLKLGGEFVDPAWGTFSVAFPSATPGLTEGSMMEFKNSGDNNMQVTFTDANSNTGTVNFAYKASSSGTAFSLADSAGDAVYVSEGVPVTRDKYIVLDAGDFSHMYEVTGVNLDGTTSSSIDLRDVFSGATTSIKLGTDNQEATVIDGQTYNFGVYSGTDTFTVTWGASSAANNTGTLLTVFPVLKGKNGEYMALTAPNTTAAYIANTTYQLPTGAVNVINVTGEGLATFAAANSEDGTSSSVTTVVSTLNLSSMTGSAEVYVGKTATGGVHYYVSSLGPATPNKLNWTVMGSGHAANVTQPAVILVEEKDDSSNRYAVIEAVSTETSGSNYIAMAGTPDFTAAENVSTRGSNSNIYDYVDLYGVYAVRDTSSQDNVKIYYPDEQRILDLYVLKSGSSVSTTGAVSGSTVEKQTVAPIKTMIGKLDTEFMSLPVTDQKAKNVISVGGPCVNKVTAQLLGKTYPACGSASGLTANTALIKLVENAFGGSKVALVVAGWEAVNTRAATSALQSYETAGLTGTEKVL